MFSAIFAASQNFVPDVVFKGNSLAGWHKLGQSEWHAEDGEIIGSPRENGGWLVLDKGYQDIAFYASFRCAGACKSGVLLRAEKTADGMKGVFVSLAEGDVAGYDVTLDAQGKEVARGKLGPGPGPMIRMSGARSTSGEEQVPGFSKPAPTRAEVVAAAAKAAAAAVAASSGNGGGGGAGRGGRGGRGGPSVTANEWHTVQIIMDADILGITIDGRNAGSASTNDRMMGFGPIALYAGGTGEVRYREVSYKDLNPKIDPKERCRRTSACSGSATSITAGAPRRRTSIMTACSDIVSGPFYYLGPEYTERHEFTAARTYNPSNQFTQGMVNFAYDFTGDGWPDILVVDQRPIYLYVNPRGESRRWDRYNVIPQASTEIELLKDIDGDGKPEVLFGGDNAMEYAKPDPANPTAPWMVHHISEKTGVSAHGMGVGDINGDGRMDVVGPRGWWEQPPKGRARSRGLSTRLPSAAAARRWACTTSMAMV